MSTIDMHFRFLINRICLDIEQALKVQLVREVSKNSDADAYEIVENFLLRNPYIIKGLETKIKSPFTGDLIKKYFDVKKVISGI